MQLTLDQSEIEEAIANYVSELISVRDGKRIDVDLKATRGADGFTAIVDIVAEDAPQRVSEETPAEPAKTLDITPKVRAARQPRTPKADPIPEQAEPEAAELAQDAGENPLDAIPEGEPADEGSIVEQAAETPVEEAPRRPSLFGNLKPPVNS